MTKKGYPFYYTHDIADKLSKLTYSAIITASADSPLIHVPITPLEIDHAQFVISLAHQADFVMGLRLLDSGTARDVSGVLRIARGGNSFNHERVELPDLEIKEREVLYYVGGDGSVKIFERGS